MGGLFSRTVYVESRNFSGIGERIEWCLKYHGRGFIGTLIPIIYGSLFGKFKDNKKNSLVIANVMVMCYILQPVSLPVSGMLPIFLLPMAGILPSIKVCKSYFTDNSCLIFMGGLLSFVLNNTGLDRRLVTRILTCGGYKPIMLIFKVCIAAYFTSFFGNHLYTSAMMYEYLDPIFSSWKVPPKPPKRDKEKDKRDAKGKKVPPPTPEFRYYKFQHLLNEALLISANLGHLNMIHSSWTCLFFRNAYYRSFTPGSTDDMLNYMQYMIFSVIFTFAALTITIIYFIVVFLVVNSNNKPMSAPNMNILTAKFEEARKHELSELRTYQKIRNLLALIFLVAFYLLCLSRYTPWFSWSIIFRSANVISDATVASGFIMIFCAFPRHFGFLKIFTANKRSEINLKPESALLFWRFVDKAVNYGYIYVIGGSIAMILAFLDSGLSVDIAYTVAPIIDGLGFLPFLAALALVTVVLTHIGSPLPMLAGMLPFVMSTVDYGRSTVLNNKAHIVAIVCGISSSFNYLMPFKNTIAFHRNHLTHTKCKHVWLHSFVMSILHAILLVILAFVLGDAIWSQTIHDVRYKKPKK